MMAKSMLEHNTRNRSLRKAVVDRYARDLANGIPPTHQGIAFYAEDGALADGQHRLAAIVQSGLSMKMLVTHGLPEISRHYIDIGAKRTATDGFAIDDGTQWIDKQIVAVIRLSHRIQYIPLPSNAEIRLYAEKHRDLLETVAVFFDRSKKAKKVGRTPVVTAYFGAINSGVPLASIRRFHEIMDEGFSTNENDRIVLRARDYVFGYTGRSVAAAEMKTICFTVMRAIKSHISRDGMRVLRAQSAPVFEMPAP